LLGLYYGKTRREAREKNIYDLLFAKRFEGRPYTDKDARGFIDWLKGGWKNQTHFVFIVRKSGSEIIGAIDIKSANLERAEVGYWADENYRGFMTNTVKQLCLLAKDVGFVKLFADVRTDNNKSIGVLERAGFVLVDGNPEKKDYIEYEKQL
jgi:RimJ/RimL family protein N-acetyltransferase